MTTVAADVSIYPSISADERSEQQSSYGGDEDKPCTSEVTLPSPASVPYNSIMDDKTLQQKHTSINLKSDSPTASNEVPSQGSSNPLHDVSSPTTDKYSDVRITTLHDDATIDLAANIDRPSETPCVMTSLVSDVIENACDVNFLPVVASTSANDERTGKEKGLENDDDSSGSSEDSSSNAGDGSSCCCAAGPGKRDLKTFLPFRCIPEQYKKEMPVEHVGLFSYLTYAWLDVFMWRAFRGRLQLWLCPEVDKGQVNADRLERFWQDEVGRAGHVSRASLSRVFLRFVRTRALLASLSQILAAVCLLVAVAYIMMSILHLTSEQNRSSPLWIGLVLVTALFVTNMLSAIFFIATVTIMQIAGARLRAAILLLLYRKLLNVTSLPDKTIGKIVNLYTNDGQRIFDGVAMLPLMLSAPLFVTGSTAYAIHLLGAWPLIGLAVLLLLVPLQMVAGKFFMRFRQKAITITDKRVRMMSEYLANARFLKMYSWEKSLRKMVAAVRAREQKVLERVNLSMSYAFLTSGILVSIATMSTLIAYTLCGNHLSSVQGFMYLLVYTVIQDKLEMCMICVKLVSELFVAAKRIQEVLVLNELSSSCSDSSKGFVQLKAEASGFNSVEFKKATFCWPRHLSSEKDKGEKPAALAKKMEADEQEKHLTGKQKQMNGSEKKSKLNEKQEAADEIERQTLLLKTRADSKLDEKAEATPNDYLFGPYNVSIERGSLAGIVGPVSSGKTSFMHAILGQMEISDGELVVSGNVGYVPQQPWIFSGTVRENIIFGSEMDKKRYDAVLEACCLQADLNVLVDGDRTEIGERGVTLSGGQKQRISLARAVYSDRDIYLLDDPLASVDHDVAEEVFLKVILGQLAGKTILLVTNSLELLPRCDYVLSLREGRLVEQGTHESLVARGGEYAKLIMIHGGTGCVNYDNPTTANSGAHPVSKDGVVAVLSGDELKVKSGMGVKAVRVENGTEKRQTMTSSSSSSRAASKSRSASPETDERETAALMTVEEKAQGAVSISTYAAYTRAAGGFPAVIAVLLVSVLAELSRAFSYWWLAYWLEQGSGNTTISVFNETMISDSIADNPRLWFYQVIYAASLGAILFFFAFRSLVIIKFLMRSSSRLHDRLFDKVLHTPILFFDSTPLGRIINRFSKDMDEMDSHLPMVIDSTVRSIVNIFMYLVLIAIIMPWFLIAIPIAGVIFIPLYLMFQVGLRELQRLNLISMSPVLSHIDVTLRGLSTIRAYNRTKDFEDKFKDLLDKNTSVMLLNHFAARWVSIRLSIVTNLLVSATALLIFLLRDDIPTNYAGAAIIYAFQLLTLFQFFVRFAVDTVVTFTSTERIRFYTKTLEEEAPMITKTFGLPAGWPTDGRIRFSDFQMRYRPELPLALNGVTFSINAREKVGIVGRTGSGKSSLVSSMFRLAEKCGGRIDIDDIDISLIGLEPLRTCLTIIPQDPVLFSGTIRSNLDPFGSHIDQELWNVLDKCHIKDIVMSMDGQLSAEVSENGDNLSQGERQLLCMARVLLRHTRIMILDEATAALDRATEDRIQTTLNDTFADRTVLIIAHRLKTVMMCDRILVMGDGKVLEFDTPTALMSNTDSHFRRMVNLNATSDNTVSEDNDLIDTVLLQDDVPSWV